MHEQTRASGGRDKDFISEIIQEPAVTEVFVMVLGSSGARSDGLSRSFCSFDQSISEEISLLGAVLLCLSPCGTDEHWKRIQNFF